MAYVNITLPESAPQKVRQYITERVELYFQDVPAMFRLPLPDQDITSGLNFSIAQILFAAISGVSTTLYDHAGKSGDLFKCLVRDYFPWEEEACTQPPEAAATILYDVFRNPLAHDTGLSVESKNDCRYLVQSKIEDKVERRLTENKTIGHSEKWIENLEGSVTRPKMGPTLLVKDGKKVLLIEGLYWCSRKMISNLAHDKDRMTRAERYLKHYA